MKNVIILGANGSLAKEVIEKLKTEKEINLTLFLRNKKNLEIKMSPVATS
jgi:saccharopine dehydrogenase-like NADP-dependent oxidoreductase